MISQITNDSTTVFLQLIFLPIVNCHRCCKKERQKIHTYPVKLPSANLQTSIWFGHPKHCCYLMHPSRFCFQNRQLCQSHQRLPRQLCNRGLFSPLISDHSFADRYLPSRRMQFSFERSEEDSPKVQRELQ